MFSTTKNDLNLLKTILKYKPDVNAKDSKNRNALFYAIQTLRRENQDLVLELLKSGINPNEVEKSCTQELDGHSPITLAAKFNYKKIVKILLEYNADPNHQVKSDLNSSLHYAISHNNEEMTNMLINSGANINILNKDESTPINMALGRSNSSIYWKLAFENERLQMDKEFSEMKDESDKVNEIGSILSNNETKIIKNLESTNNVNIVKENSENIQTNKSINYCISNININNINININNTESKIIFF